LRRWVCRAGSTVSTPPSHVGDKGERAAQPSYLHPCAGPVPALLENKYSGKYKDKLSEDRARFTITKIIAKHI